MTNIFPELQINVTRNGNIESKHFCHVAIARTSKENTLGWGDVDDAYFPRSAIKMFQALEFIISGTAKHFKCNKKEIALACASHVGDKIHRQIADSWLTRIGLSVSDLECGYHHPFSRHAFEKLIKDKSNKSQLCNNCSGKHVAMLSLALFRGYETKGYINVSHPVQQDIMATMSSFMFFDFKKAKWGIDGCGVPTWKIPLSQLASAIQRFALHEGLNESQKTAASILWDAMTCHPELISGNNTFDTKLIQLGKNEMLSKTGAEGVCVFAHKPSGTFVTIKSSDGSERSAQAALRFIIKNSNWYSTQAINEYIPDEVVKTINGKRVGEVIAFPSKEQTSSLQKHLANESI